MRAVCSEGMLVDINAVSGRREAAAASVRIAVDYFRIQFKIRMRATCWTVSFMYPSCAQIADSQLGFDSTLRSKYPILVARPLGVSAAAM